MTPVLSEETVIIFSLVLFRIAALVAVLPVTGSEQIPARVKGGLAFFMALLVVFFARKGPMPVPQGFGAVALAACGEIFIGLAMGMSVRIVMEAVNFAGNMAGFQMGLTIANVIDPQTGAQVSVIGNLQVLMAAVIFLVTGLYLRFIEGILRSFEIVGPGAATLRPEGLRIFIELGGNLFVQAVSIGAPWIISLFLANVGMGLMARTFPQMNVFFVGFPVTIGVGFSVMALATPFVFASINTYLVGSEKTFWLILRAVMPG